MTETFDPARPGVYVGARVRELREHRRMTLEALVAGLHNAPGLPFDWGNWLVDLEKGRLASTEITLHQILRLAQALHVKPATLLPERLPAGRRGRGKEASRG